MTTYKKFNGERLIWTSDLESLKNFVENCLQQQGKWTSPGGNNKQFKSCNDKLVITWYFKKQLTLVFQGQDGPFLKEKLFKLVQDRFQISLAPVRYEELAWGLEPIRNGEIF